MIFIKQYKKKEGRFMFLSDDFLLKDDWAKKLYHSYAKNMP
ncbi:glucuronate isomerase, partial [Enterococcus faecium]